MQATDIRSLEDALLSGEISGDSIDVRGVPPNTGSGFYISPSRAAWSAAQSAGLTALLPADQAKLFGRLDYNTAEEISADAALHDTLNTLVSECIRAQYDHSKPAVQRIRIPHRDDLLFQLEQVQGAIRNMIGSLGLAEGGDEAILAGVHSLDEMYTFQKATLQRNHIAGAPAGFFGINPAPQSQPLPNQPGGTE